MIRIVLGLVACLLSFTDGAALAAQQPARTLVFGVFAYLGQEQTREKYQPLVDYLNGKLEEEHVVLEVLSQDEIRQRVAERTLDIVTTNPTHFIHIRSQSPLTGVIATLVNRSGGKPVHMLGGAIVVKAERNDIGSLKDLRGKTIAAPSLDHMGGYRAQAYELHKAGIRLNEGHATVIQTELHENAILYLLDGRADAAFVRDGILERMIRDGSLAPETVRVLNEQNVPYFPHRVSTALYPEWPVVALPHVDERSVRHLASALYALESDHQAARAAGIHGYTIAADYFSVETLLRTLRLPPFDEIPDFTIGDVWRRWSHASAAFLTAIGLIVVLSALLVVGFRRERSDRRRFELLLSSLGEGVYGVDATGCTTFINDTALAALGFRRDQVLGSDQHALFHHHHPDGSDYLSCDCPIHQTLLDGAPRYGQDAFIRADGRVFPVYLKVAPTLWAGRCVGAVVVFRDITDELRIDAERDRLIEQLDRASKELQRFAEISAHHLQEPARRLGSYAGLLRKHLPEAVANEGTVSSALTFIEKQSQRLRSLVRDVQLYLTAGGDAVDPIDPAPAIHKVKTLMGPQFDQAGGTLRIGDIPPLPLDVRRLKDILSILLVNAIRYHDRTRPIIVQVDAESVRDGVVVRIADNGPGIPEPYRQRVFEVFERLTPSADPESTGIGLAIVRRVMESIEGRAWIDETPGGGTTVNLYFFKREEKVG